jgi:hypothetical protein
MAGRFPFGPGRPAFPGGIPDTGDRKTGIPVLPIGDGQPEPEPSDDDEDSGDEGGED